MNPKSAPVRILGAVGLLALLGLWAAGASARHHASQNVAGGPSGQFDYYLLVLSWAPSYCITHPGDRSECGTQGYGFVLHGLWPQFDAGGYPEACSSDATLDEVASAIGRTLYPSARLMQHEWEAHGTCSGLSAADYFRTADRALAVVQVTAALEPPQPDQMLSGAQISGQFLASNPALAGEDLAIACNRGILTEVRVCLTRELRPRACGRRVRSSCGGQAVQVPGAR